MAPRVIRPKRAARDLIAIVGLPGAERIAAEVMQLRDEYDRQINAIGLERSETNPLLEARTNCTNFARVLRREAEKEYLRLTTL